jgi:hypothetical protein
MTELVVQIDRFVDAHQPGFVECSLVDALGRKHLIVEKIPIVTTENIWTDSQYPKQGAIACQVEREWRAEDGRLLAQVSTELPWHVESTSGESSFVVLASQVRSQRAA